MTASQSGFRAALLDPDHPVPEGLTDGAGRSTTKRFAVYRNNVTVALIDALRAGFPVLAKLLGDQNFDQMARLFARAHPPSSPLMMHYGDALPAFLDTFAPLAHIGYLPDVARLELALRRSYHAADGIPMDATRLGTIDPDVLMQTRMRMAPAVQVVSSRWPILDIWRYNMVEGAPKPRRIPQAVLVTRTEYDPEPHGVSASQAAWLTAILADATLEDAVDIATDIEADFALGPLLTLLLQHNALIDMITPEE